LDPDRWSRVNELVGRALERPPGERQAFLEEVCDDAEVRREAASLLDQDPAGCAALDRPPYPLLHAAPEAAILELPEIPAGERIGAYRVVEELGRGGMGVVYLAERADEEFERRVAIKVLKRGLDTAEIVRRFRTERQILANLQHPGIAELYEGGTTHDGRPYVVLEYVEGERIDRYCDRHHLGLRLRLELFRRVSAAVETAHRHLVVHRDLKPANILVTEEGQPKLLDFGIAKLLDPEGQPGGDGAPLTVAGTRPMTPEYASPEQIRGEPVTTATDVYALGALLYELLTGRRPYGLDRESGGVSSAEELRRAICEQDPLRPSVAVTRAERNRVAREGSSARGPERSVEPSAEPARRLGRRLRGDLDDIVLQALEKDPRRRYSSVEQLSEDVQRHLDGLPVRARRPTLVYRTGKYVRRNARQVAVAGVAVVALAGFLGDREIQQQRTAEALTRAQRVSDFLVDLFEVADPSEARGNTITAREVLDDGARRIQTELGDEPEIRASLLQTIGAVYRNLGLYDAARPLLDEAVALRREHGSEPGDLEQSLYEAGYLAYEQGDYDRAERLYRQALAAKPRWGEDRDLTANLLNNLGLIRHARGDYREAESLYRQALEISRALHGDLHPDVTAGLANLAAVLRWQGDDAGAERILRQVLHNRRKVWGEEHPAVAMTLNSLGMLEAARGDFASGEKDLREALAISRQVYPDDHPNVALVLGNLCGLLHASGRDTEAEATCERALAMNRRLLGEHPHVAANLVTLGEIRLAQGRPEDANDLLNQALEIYRKTLPDGHWRIAEAQSVLGACATALCHYDDAERLLTTTYPVLRKSTPPGSRHATEARDRLVALYCATGRPEKAKALRPEGTTPCPRPAAE